MKNRFFIFLILAAVCAGSGDSGAQEAIKQYPAEDGAKAFQADRPLWTDIGISSDALVFDGIEFPAGAISFADAVPEFDPLFSGGPAPSAQYSNTDEATGVPDSDHLTLGRGGRAVLQFLDNVLTGSGDDQPDLHIFEVGPDVEDTFVEISKDGVNWHDIGKVFGGTSSIDIDAFGFGPQDQFAWVRLTDDPNEGGSSGSSVGADIDAVGAIATAPADFGILQQPRSMAVDEFSMVELTVTPTGSGPFSYEWFFDGTALCGETGRSLILPSIRIWQEGSYHVVITENGEQSLQSEPAEITVRPAGLEDRQLYYNGNISFVLNNPTAPTVIQIDEAVFVTRIQNYHWNFGMGQTPGTIALSDQDGTIWGPWQAYGSCGQGGVLNANWMAYPMLTLPPGTYTVVDSHPSTWAQNSGSSGQGFTWLFGLGADETGLSVDIAARSGSDAPWSGLGVIAPEEQTLNLDAVSGSPEEFEVLVSTGGLGRGTVTLRCSTIPAGWGLDVELIGQGNPVDVTDQLQSMEGLVLEDVAAMTSLNLVATITPGSDGPDESPVEVSFSAETVSGQSDSILIQTFLREPPQIVTQPQGQTLQSGQPLVLEVEATGTLPLSYQWFFNGEIIDDATGETYSIGAVTMDNGGEYTVRVTSPYGSVTSDPAVIEVTSQGLVFDGIEFPAGAISFADAVPEFDPLFSGGPAPSAQYSNTDEAIGVPNYDHLTLGRGGRAVLQFLDNVLTGSGDDKPDLHIFEVGPDVEDTFVEISKDGVTWHDVGKVFGGTSSIDIDAFGFGPQDQFAWVRLTDDPNEGGSSGSSVGADIDAVGAIATAPAEFGILLQPRSMAVDEFSMVELTVTPTGSGTFTYQWFFDGSALCGETARSLMIPSIRTWQEGSYHVVITENGERSLQSEPAEITVRPAGFEDSQIFYNGNIAAVQNQPTAPTIIQIEEPTFVTRLENYHWNSAAGKTPGTIALTDQDGTTWGPWQAYGRCGQGGVLNAYWTTYPMLTLPPGTYTVVDSDPATWSQNSGSSGRGMTWLFGASADEVIFIESITSDITVGVGQSATLEVTASGQMLEYGWAILNPDGSMDAIDGANSAVFQTGPVMDPTTYVVTVSNGMASLTSGPVTVTLDVREGSLANPLPNPGALQAYRPNTGSIYYFTVTGINSGNVWGTDIYTDDSRLAKAAVHAGALAIDETGVVRVTILPGQSSYIGSTRNGVTTSDYASWSGSYSVERAIDLPSGPEVSITLVENGVELSWVGGTPPFTIKTTSNINAGPWIILINNYQDRSIVFPASEAAQFFSVTED